MATGRTLAQVLADVCVQVGVSSVAAQQQDIREALKTHIRNEQERLIDDYDWLPFKNATEGSWFDVTLVAGERYYDWPDGFDYKTLKGMWCLMNGTWLPINYGITLDDYTAFSSEDDERADPVQKWDFHTEEQLEIWPLPVDDGGTIRLEGRQLPDVVAASESTVMVIDHIALSKFAAASFLRSRPDETGENRRLASERYAEGLGRITTLKARKGKHTTRMNFARTGRMPDMMDPRFRIRVAS